MAFSRSSVCGLYNVVGSELGALGLCRSYNITVALLYLEGQEKRLVSTEGHGIT